MLRSTGWSIFVQFNLGSGMQLVAVMQYTPYNLSVVLSERNWVHHLFDVPFFINKIIYKTI